MNIDLFLGDSDQSSTISSNQTLIPLGEEDAELNPIWENAGYYLLYFCVGSTLVLIAFGFLFHKCIVRGADDVGYVALFRFFSNIADFGSDALLTIVFYLIDEQFFFLLSLIFTLLPYFLSCIIGVYWIERWRNDVDNCLSNYLKKYDILLICLTVITGFYSAVELARSKLFYLKMFNLQIRKDNITQLKNSRFFTNVVFEV